MTRRLSDAVPDYELRGALVRVARNERFCDVAGCGASILPYQQYAYINTGIAVCSAHFDPAYVIEEEK